MKKLLLVAEDSATLESDMSAERGFATRRRAGLASPTRLQWLLQPTCWKTKAINSS
jgi:hypothetical protein